MMLDHLLMQDHDEWERLVLYYEEQVKALRVPDVNDVTTLHLFNRQLDELFTQAEFDFARARRLKDAAEMLLDSVLKDYYKGSNESQRKAGGIQLARHYPAPDYYSEETINLYELVDKFRWYYYALHAALKALEAKSSAKITNNSILNIERSLIAN